MSQQKITLGKLGQNIPGPTNPDGADDLFTAHGNYKFTIWFGDKPLIVPNNMGFDEFMVLTQTQNNRDVLWGAADAAGNFVENRRAQQSMAIYRASTAGQADLVEAPKLRFQGPPGSVATFTYGKDN